MSAINDSMYSQYLAWYQRHLAKYGNKTAVLMQVGKFYEIYDRLNLVDNSTKTNIREIADLCSLNLSESKDPNNADLIKLFGGFPEPSLPKFEKQLLDAGYTVVIVVQKKNTKGDVEDRIVERISSPGIYEPRYSAGRLEDISEPSLIGILLSRNDARSFYAGLAAIDVNTGQTWSTESVIQFIQGMPNIDEIEPFFLMHPPAEVICWSSDITESELRNWFHFQKSTKIHIRKEPIERPNSEFLIKAYSFKTNLQPLTVLGLERYPQAYNCLYGLLQFVEEHIPSLLKSLKNNSLWIPENRVRLGNAALEQLNIISNNSESLLNIFQKTYTALGRRNLRERVLTPISDLTVLEERFARIAFLSNCEISVEKELRAIYDLSRLHRKLHLCSITILDVIHLLSSYRSIAELIKKFSGTILSIKEEDKILQWLSNDLWCEVRIKTSESLNLEKTHPYKREAFPILDSLEDDWLQLIQEVREYLTSINDVNSYFSLQIGDSLPFYITTTKKRYEKLQQAGLNFHPISIKSSVGTIESKEIQQFQKRGEAILKLWSNTQEEIWLDTINKWSERCNATIFNSTFSDFISDWIGQLDTEHCLARLSKEYGYVIPIFLKSANSSVSIKGLRHPIIERLTNTPYIKHDISLGLKSDLIGEAERGLMIYGTNASGKSSLMKALGIAVLCAQTGIPISCSEMKITPYNSIFTRILGNDNIWSGLSSFAVEMTEFRAILKYADSKSLILGDELCSGTETRSATAIVSAGIQTLVNRGSQFLFATHLHEISELEEIRRLKEIQIVHLGIKYDSATNQIIYNRDLEIGAGSSLYGLEVCYGLDMDPEFLDLATKCRKKVSRYNSQVVVTCCSICKSTNNLETHHIKEQAVAKAGFVDFGLKTHAIGNLVILCDFCHNEHHNGNIIINGWKDTSFGRNLEYTRVEKKEILNNTDIDFFPDIKDKLKLLYSKKKKEKEILLILKADFGIEAKNSELRKWKKRL